MVSGGLGSEMWRSVVDSIAKLVEEGCYEKVNKFLSLGLLGRLRKRAASMLRPGVVLDAGCGPGTSTEYIRSIMKNSLIIMVDPSERMLRMARSRLGGPLEVAVAGRFERLPLADSSVDSIVAMFSFRDAYSYGKAVEEFARVLKPDGVLVILDFYRPTQPWKTILIIYIMIMVPLALIFNRCKVRINLYRDFPETIAKMLGAREIRELFGKYFTSVELKRVVPGLGFIVARGPRWKASREASQRLS